MSYNSVIRHIQQILNDCGDPVIFIPTGHQAMGEHVQMVIEIRTTAVLRQNRCFALPPPTPMATENRDNQYLVNRIRISVSLAGDYSKNNPLTDDELRGVISDKTFLFGYYAE